ncbi:hypothetical protein ETAA8_59880 [Anatilimnocola aggregata]|uniref:Uncharacterized protein n=1 Tax=Anatilimnocola aggregata TaxID=2528021 RepID=A0A517YKU4_9BACT|nr:DUF6655 family protein [Anatilimnocola aggregata]QDU30839.1 hypothetical protein ETAA8_59880 [Anatilimnocola aggregata]
MNKSRLATEQLVVADAVDHAVSQIDFSPLSGKKVFFDKQYMPASNAPNRPPMNNSNVEYVISSLRQQMLAYNCQLQDKPETADIIVEARLGALGSDGNEATYGLPTGVVVRTAAAAMAPGGESLPTMPDLALGRRNHQLGAARIGVFAYDQRTREPVWQAGVATGNSQARDLWVLGIGPFQNGRIYDQVQSTTHGPKLIQGKDKTPKGMANYLQPQTFQRALAADEQNPARILTPASLETDSNSSINPASSMAGSRP